MNFIEEWCKNRCSLKNACDVCTETCFPRFRLAEAVGCSEYLIWILMNERNGKTHPLIADAIADYIGATSEQRDSIVDKKHHGKYKPNPKRKFQNRKRFRRTSWNAKGVVAIDRVGNIVKRYDSSVEAAEQFGCSSSSIAYRCNRYRISKDEFKPYGMTFRFSAEWDQMTEDERRRDLEDMKVGV